MYVLKRSCPKGSRLGLCSWTSARDRWNPPPLDFTCAQKVTIKCCSRLNMAPGGETCPFNLCPHGLRRGGTSGQLLARSSAGVSKVGIFIIFYRSRFPMFLAPQPSCISHVPARACPGCTEDGRCGRWLVHGLIVVFVLHDTGGVRRSTPHVLCIRMAFPYKGMVSTPYS